MGKQILSWVLRIITILLIVILLLGSGVMITASLTGREGVLGYQIYLPTDTETEFENAAVVVKVEDQYLLGDTVLFPTIDGVKTAHITSEGDFYNLSITDTGEFYAASSEEILGRAVFYSYPVATVFAFLTKNWIAAFIGAFLLFCILLAVLILLSVKGKKRKGEEASAEKTPKIVEEQIAYEEKEKAPLGEADRAEQVSEFVVFETEEGEEETDSALKAEPMQEPSAQDEFPSKEEVQKILEQETKEMVWEKAEPKEKTPVLETEEELPKEEIPPQAEAEIGTELTPQTEEESPKQEEEPAADAISSVRNHFAELEKELEAFKADLLNDDK